MPGWKPNRKQWRIIWAAIVVVALCLVAQFFIGAVAAFVIGGALVWRQSKTTEAEPDTAVKRVYCGECGGAIEPHWRVCPNCGSESWKA